MGLRRPPYAFTEQGVSMLSAVLKSKTAIEVSIQIIDAFVEMRKLLFSHSGILESLDQFELKLSKHDEDLTKIFNAIEEKAPNPEQGVFFDGQLYDAYSFVSKLIRSANNEIMLIDNYLDESVLTMLSKRKKGVVATIYTRKFTNQFKLDVEKYNQQYEQVNIKILANFHDRFLIIDRQELYHVGASFKDLGKKWFAFSKMDVFIDRLLSELEK
jgi:hypothetical protein